jgi:hypothetical protein
VTEKNEDLSLIDDEMTIQHDRVNQIVNNRQVIELKGIISNVIQPQILQSVKQHMGGAQRGSNNEGNIFINNCQINNNPYCDDYINQQEVPADSFSRNAA